MPNCAPILVNELASRIFQGDAIALEQFYSYMMELRPIVVTRLPEYDPDDILHETFAVALEAMQKGELRRPWAIRAYVLVILKRLIANRIGRVIQDRARMVDDTCLASSPAQSGNPESSFLDRERTHMLTLGMSRLQKRDCELLTRFYINDQPWPDICREMQLTERQFNNFKHRAKAALAGWVSSAELGWYPSRYTRHAG